MQTFTAPMHFYIKTFAVGLNFCRYAFADNMKTFTIEDRGNHRGKQIAGNVAESIRSRETLQITENHSNVLTILKQRISQR
jgi:hypothetical protein